MTTITNGTATIAPTIVTGWKAARSVRTIAHDIIGRSDPDVTFAPAGLRSGTLEVLFDDEAAATVAFDLLIGAYEWTLADPDRASVGMTFVVAGGDAEFDLEDESRDLWLIRVPYREVSS